MKDETLTIIEPSVNGSEPRVLRFEDGEMVDKGTYMEALRKAELQRDELLEALKEFVNNSSVQSGFPSLCEEAEKAITKAEGGNESKNKPRSV